MPVLSTDFPRLSNWLKHVYDYSSGYCFETIAKSSLAAGTKTGTVITAAGAVVAAASTADTWGIVVDDLNDARMAYNTQVLVLVRGPAKVAFEALTFNADINTDLEKTALKAKLATLGILADKQF